jgi:hypothetical protein
LPATQCYAAADLGIDDDGVSGHESRGSSV